MKTLEYLKKAVTLPPHMVLKKVGIKLKKIAKRKKRAFLDARYPSYLKSSPFHSLRRFIKPIDLSLLDRKAIEKENEHYLRHEFNLLGSGWVQIQHGMSCQGLEGFYYPPKAKGSIHRANQKESKRISDLLPASYTPIDWHLDFKSGYRWEESCPSEEISYGKEPGVDVKVPWELSRMQHLISLAWGFAFEKDVRFLQEIEHQILDFISSNPPRFGVNWQCTMDVGIRIANWLVSYDLCKAYGASFSPQFEQIFFRSIHEHAEHILSYLEWDPYLRSNHYLANIAGLFFIGAYLPKTVLSSSWLTFGFEELQKELRLQFHPSGSNFEASTSYHRLSSEMIVYSAALASQLGLHFPQDLIQKMGDFTRDMTKPDGTIVQIGDNDSGRFLKFFPDQSILHHSYLVASIRNLSSLSSAIKAQLQITPEKPRPGSYPEFGLFFQKKGPWSLAIRCGSIGQRGNGGHAHQDLLSFDLSYKTHSLIVDPGTYVYTPLPEQRNQFRSASMHNTLCPEKKQQYEEIDLFQMRSRKEPRLLHFDETLFMAEHLGFGAPHRRELHLSDESIVGIDECALPQSRIYFHFAPEWQGKILHPQKSVWTKEKEQIEMEIETGSFEILPSFYSKEYGVKENNQALIIHCTSPLTRWKINSHGL